MTAVGRQPGLLSDNTLICRHHRAWPELPEAIKAGSSRPCLH